MRLGMGELLIILLIAVLLFGGKSWQYLALILSIIPITASILFRCTKLPAMQTSKDSTDVASTFTTAVKKAETVMKKIAAKIDALE